MTCAECIHKKFNNHGFKYTALKKAGAKKSVLVIKPKLDFQDSLNDVLTLPAKLDFLKSMDTNIVVTSVLRCNVTTTWKHIRFCADDILWKLIDWVKPYLIIAIGANASKYFLNSVSINSIRGRSYTINSKKTGSEYMLLPILDFGSGFFDPSKNKLIAQDLNKIKDLIDNGKKEIPLKFYKHVHIENIQALECVHKEALDQKFISVDLETTGLNMFDKEFEIYIISLSTESNTGIMIYWRDVILYKEIRDIVLSILANKNIKKIGVNFKYDLKCLKAKEDILVKGYADDITIMHYLINELRGTHSLDKLSWEYTGEGGYKDEMHKYIKEGRIKEAPLDVALEYSCKDVDIAITVLNKLRPEIKKQDLGFIYKLCMQTNKTLTLMELRGAKIDSKLLTELTYKFEREVLIMTKDFDTYLIKKGYEPININSYKQLGDLLFNKLGVKPVKYTKNKKKTTEKSPSTDAEAMEIYSKKYKWAKMILGIRKHEKLLSTYLRGIAKHLDDNDFIHCVYSVYGTVTGRLACSNPNLQNIPRSGDTTDENNPFKYIKRIFISRFGDNGCILEADFSQLELRIAAMVSGDEVMIDMIKSGIDLHLRTAQIIFRDDTLDEDSPERVIAKTLNFGILYGMGAYKLSHSLNCSELEAENFIRKYFARFRGLYEWIQETKKGIVKDKEVRNMLGRVRRLPDVKSNDKGKREAALREGINSPIQGLASDLNLLALNDINKTLMERRFKSAINLTVHDSILADCLATEVNEVAKVFRDCMTKVRFDFMKVVPLAIDIKYGKNWSDTKKYKIKE